MSGPLPNGPGDVRRAVGACPDTAIRMGIRIIGAGLSGLARATALRTEGREVMLLDRLGLRRFGQDASGRPFVADAGGAIRGLSITTPIPVSRRAERGSTLNAPTNMRHPSMAKVWACRPDLAAIRRRAPFEGRHARVAKFRASGHPCRMHDRHNWCRKRNGHPAHHPAPAADDKVLPRRRSCPRRCEKEHGSGNVLGRHDAPRRGLGGDLDPGRLIRMGPRPAVEREIRQRLEDVRSAEDAGVSQRNLGHVAVMGRRSAARARLPAGPSGFASRSRPGRTGGRALAMRADPDYRERGFSPRQHGRTFLRLAGARRPRRPAPG